MLIFLSLLLLGQFLFDLWLFRTISILDWLFYSAAVLPPCLFVETKLHRVFL
jgi:hypothetical protein